MVWGRTNEFGSAARTAEMLAISTERIAAALKSLDYILLMVGKGR